MIPLRLLLRAAAVAAVVVTGGARTAAAVPAAGPPSPVAPGQSKPACLHILSIPTLCFGPGPAATGPGAPVPAIPGSGMSGMLDPTPAGGDTKYGVQGYAGLHWPTYNSPSFVKSPSAAINAGIEDGIGNRLYGGAVDIVALGNGLHRQVDPPRFLSAFDPLVSRGSSALVHDLWIPFAGLAVTGVGLTMLFHTFRRDHASVTRSAWWAAAVMALVAWVLVAPLTLGRVGDGVVSSVDDSVYSQVDGSQASTPAAAGSLMFNEVLFPLWERGELGSSDSETATKYGPALLQANGYTWAETGGNGQKTPSAATTARLQNEFQVVAEHINKTDPAAYAHMDGTANGRISTGFMAIIAALVTTGFRVAADVLAVTAYLLVRLAVILIAPIALISVNRRFAGPLIDLLTLVGVVILGALAFAIAAAVDVLAAGILLSPTSKLAWWFGLLLLVAATAGLWYAVRPVRRALSSTVSSTTGIGMNRRRRHQTRRTHQTQDLVAALTAAGLVTAVAASALPSAGAVPEEAETPTVIEMPEEAETGPAPLPPTHFDPTVGAYVDDNPLAPVAVPLEESEPPEPLEEAEAPEVEPEKVVA